MLSVTSNVHNVLLVRHHLLPWSWLLTLLIGDMMENIVPVRCGDSLFSKMNCIRKWTCQSEEDTSCMASLSISSASEGCFVSTSNQTEDGSNLRNFTARRYYKRNERLYDKCTPGLSLTWSTQLTGRKQIVLLQIWSNDDEFKNRVECVKFDISTESTKLLTLHFDCLAYLKGSMELQMTSLVEGIPQQPRDPNSGPLVFSTGELDNVKWVYDTKECMVLPSALEPRFATRRIITTPGGAQEVTSDAASSSMTEENASLPTLDAVVAASEDGNSETRHTDTLFAVIIATAFIAVCALLIVIVIIYKRLQLKRLTETHGHGLRSTDRESVIANHYNHDTHAEHKRTCFPNNNQESMSESCPQDLDGMESCLMAVDVFSLDNTSTMYGFHPPIEEHHSANTEAFADAFGTTLPPHQLVRALNQRYDDTSDQQLTLDQSSHMGHTDHPDQELIGSESDHAKPQDSLLETSLNQYERLDEDTDTYTGTSSQHQQPRENEHDDNDPSDPHLEITDQNIMDVRDSGFSENCGGQSKQVVPDKATSLSSIDYPENTVSPAGSALSIDM